MDFKYKTNFSAPVKPIVSEEKDIYLAMASIEKLQKFLPNIDVEKNVDLLPIAFNSFVANRVNKNGDVVDTKTSIEIYEHFKNKPINVEHNRKHVIGSVLTAGFSEFGTDKPLSLDEVKDTNGPFNVVLGGVVWKVVDSRVAERIENSGDPDSDHYLSVSASWELGFNEYVVALAEMGEKNLENAEIISDKDKINDLKENMKSYGGTGYTEDGKEIFRKVTGSSVVPLGIGLTQNPAADVEGLITNKENTNILLKDDDSATEISENQEENATHSNSEIKENINNEKTISHQVKTDVNENKDSTIMEIKNIKDINDESLQELSASDISDFIESELEKASEQYSAEKREVEDALSAAKEDHDKLQGEHEKMKEELESAKSAIEQIEAEKLERDKQEQFKERMTSLDEKYDLTEDEREVIASDIQDLDEDGYAEYSKKMSVLLSNKEKKEEAEASVSSEEAGAPAGCPECYTFMQELNKASNREEFEKLIAGWKSRSKASEDEVEASEENTEEVVDEAIEQAELETEGVPVTSEASDPTVFDKYKEAFTVEGFDIKL